MAMGIGNANDVAYTTALAIVDSKPPKPTVTDEDKEALRRTVAAACDDAQFKVFVLACNRLGLDPFARQIVPIVQSGKMTPQVTIDGFRLIAERTRKYRGQYGPYWCGKDGVWHEVWTAAEDPIAARIGVIRADFDQPLYDVAHMRSYRKDGSPTWKQLPIEMLAKVAEARALRRAFPQELSGIYTDDEMDQASSNEPQRNAQAQAQAQAQAHHNPVTVRPMTASRPTSPNLGSLRLRLKTLTAPAPLTTEKWESFLAHQVGTPDAKRIGADELEILDNLIAGMESERQAEHELGITYTDDPGAPIGTSSTVDAGDLSTVGVGRHPAN